METGPLSAVEGDAARSGAHERRFATLRRIPSLDGLRAISIFLVVALHTLQRYSLHHAVNYTWRAIFNGSLGVSIFFVISGYLITSLLLKEHSGRGSISLSGFFVKRAFRILPPIFAYVAVLLVLASVGRMALSRVDVASTLLFFHDYVPKSRSWALEHFWSLSVEEQFYLVWPLALLFCLHRGGVTGRRWAATVTLAVIAVSPVIRVLSFLARNLYVHNPSSFHMHADALAFGCSAALLQGTARFEGVYRAATRLPWLVPVLLLLESYAEVRWQNRWNAPVGGTLSAFLITMLLLWCVRNPDTRAGRVLNAPPIVHLGVLSYSIYLWQTLFLHNGNDGVFRGVEWMSRMPGSWIALLVVAEISYHGVEQPALRLRNALMRRTHLYRVQPEGRSPLQPLSPAKLVD